MNRAEPRILAWREAGRLGWPTALVVTCAGLAAVFGAAGLLGWLLEVEFLRRFAPHFVSMNPATAIGLIAAAAGISLALTRWSTASRAAGLLAAAIGAAKLADLLTGAVPIDRLLFSERLVGDLGDLPNRMAPNTAATLLMGGLGITLLRCRWRHATTAAQLLAMWMTATACFALIGYSFDLLYFSKLGSFIPMALPTALGVLALGASLLALTRESALLKILCDDGPAGAMSRVVLPLLVTIPVITGTFRIWCQQHGYFDDQAGMAMQIMSNVMVTSTLLMVCAMALYRSDLIRREREVELRNSEQFNRLVASANPDCISLLDDDCTVRFANEALIRAHGAADVSELIGKPYGHRLDRAAQAERDIALAAARADGVGRFTLRYPDPNGGDPRWYDTIISKLPPDHDWSFRYLAISRDVSEKREIEDQVRWKASHDDLTHLPNRAQFQAHLDRHVRRVGQQGFGLLMLDIDNFKTVNDTLGHDAGDVLLKTVAERLVKAVRAGDIVARLAGDEFAVIAPGIRTEPGVTSIAERIFESLREPWLYDGRLGECRVTIGASLAPRHGDTSEELLKHADIALYEAKSRGKGQIAVFRPRMKSAVERRTRQISLARHALSRDFIVPYYQPKIELPTGRVAGFEALLRWRHPKQGIQMPNTIEAAFEDLELASCITERMLTHVLLDMRRWLDRDLPFGHVAINVTAADLRRDNFADRLLQNLADHGLPHDRLQVEITETVFMGRGAEYVERALRMLHDAGIRVALDDFGTGYASLSHLKQFPVDIVKIDRSFLHDFALDPQNQAIINTVISLGHSLDIEIVAEGIETHEQERHLLARGCTYGQGFLYGRAVPALRVPGLLRTARGELRKAA